LKSALELLIFYSPGEEWLIWAFLPSFISVLPDRLYLVVDEFRFEMLRNSHHLGSKLTTSQLSEVLKIGIICASISPRFREGDRKDRAAPALVGGRSGVTQSDTSLILHYANGSMSIASRELRTRSS